MHLNALPADTAFKVGLNSFQRLCCLPLGLTTIFLMNNLGLDVRLQR